MHADEKDSFNMFKKMKAFGRIKEEFVGVIMIKAKPLGFYHNVTHELELGNPPYKHNLEQSFAFGGSTKLPTIDNYTDNVDSISFKYSCVFLFVFLVDPPSIFFGGSSTQFLSMGCFSVLTLVDSPTSFFKYRHYQNGGLNFELFGDGFVAEIEEMTVISPFTKYMKNLCHRKSSSLILCKFPPLSPRALRGNTIDSFSLTLQFDDFTYILPNKVDYKRDPTFNPLNNNKTFVFDPAAGDNTIVITVHLGFLTTVIGSLQYPTKRTSHFQYEVIAFVSVPAIVVGLVLMACLYRRRNRRELETFDNQEINLGYEMLLTSPTNYRRGVSESIMVVLKDKHLLISSDDLHLGDVVGQGNFGIVYEGTLKCGNTMEKVAVKTLHKRNPRKIDIDEFINEALQMFNFQHENVMPLTGICLSLDEMPLIVLPFMQHGNLLTFIMKTDRVLTLIRLLQFGLDIAKGMLYISTKCIVHRDLAARNCLLDENEVAIVSDFVLSRDIYEKDYYTSSNQKCKLPVKWMAPESLEKGIYNTQSDVWSYGVVLWELLTRGSKPYPEVDGWDMLKYLKSNRRLHKPLYCPDVVYRLTEKCWALDPCNRPTFSDIVEELTSLIATRDQHFSKENTFENIEDINISTEVDFDC
ncbi:tyrosine-protein kinase receptor UFO-like [Saccostrea echinata]|uniref:tyrosine-protein kinase receptor UFO-like n=1 Tax=Saccostrea echinata TaxID=191078 RepID=UPI002A7F97D2|nr:tyrosine-protein kinase receptor UFO-like [Saccostrea echinata]